MRKVRDFIFSAFMSNACILQELQCRSKIRLMLLALREIFFIPQLLAFFSFYDAYCSSMKTSLK